MATKPSQNSLMWDCIINNKVEDLKAAHITPSSINKKSYSSGALAACTVARRKMWDVLDVLIDKGANLHLSDDQFGQTPMDLIFEAGPSIVIKYIEHLTLETKNRYKPHLQKLKNQALVFSSQEELEKLAPLIGIEHTTSPSIQEEYQGLPTETYYSELTEALKSSKKPWWFTNCKPPGTTCHPHPEKLITQPFDGFMVHPGILKLRGIKTNSHLEDAPPYYLMMLRVYLVASRAEEALIIKVTESEKDTIPEDLLQDWFKDVGTMLFKCHLFKAFEWVNKEYTKIFDPKKDPILDNHFLFFLLSRQQYWLERSDGSTSHKDHYVRPEQKSEAVFDLIKKAVISHGLDGNMVGERGYSAIETCILGDNPSTLEFLLGQTTTCLTEPKNYSKITKRSKEKWPKGKPSNQIELAHYKGASEKLIATIERFQLKENFAQKNQKAAKNQPQFL